MQYVSQHQDQHVSKDDVRSIESTESAAHLLRHDENELQSSGLFFSDRTKVGAQRSSV